MARKPGNRVNRHGIPVAPQTRERPRREDPRTLTERASVAAADGRDSKRSAKIFEQAGKKTPRFYVAAARMYAKHGMWGEVDRILEIIEDLRNQGNYEPSRTAESAIETLKRHEAPDSRSARRRRAKRR